ncbi:MAG: hypothetical protein R3324_19305, partial [Halobacteriales archaeon]|nr:hypothetical protein [Halobacteriales archaeon]
MADNNTAKILEMVRDAAAREHFFFLALLVWLFGLETPILRDEATSRIGDDWRDRFPWSPVTMMRAIEEIIVATHKVDDDGNRKVTYDV